MAEQKSVVVTGASTGIGYGIAQVLGARGIHVFGGVRKRSDANRLARELGAMFTPLLMDVTDEAGVHAAAGMAAQQLGNRTLLGLVNNAGIGSGGPLLHQPIAEFRQTLEVNLLGPFTVTKAFAPLLGPTVPDRSSWTHCADQLCWREVWRAVSRLLCRLKIRARRHVRELAARTVALRN